MATETHKLKVAKADEKDRDLTRSFFLIMEYLFDSRGFISNEENWERELDEDDPDLKALLRIRKNVAEEEGYSEKSVDNRLVLFEFMKEKYRKCNCHWGRVIMAADVLIDNVCDPNVDHLKFDPFIERALEDAILGE